jgi:hypothetical protein
MAGGLVIAGVGRGHHRPHRLHIGALAGLPRFFQGAHEAAERLLDEAHLRAAARRREVFLKLAGARHPRHRLGEALQG